MPPVEPSPSEGAPRRRSAVRRWVSRHLAVPVVILLRGWVLNRVVSQIPLPRVRYAYYRRVCGIRIGRGSSVWLGAQFTGGAIDRITIEDHCSIGFDSFWVAGAPITVESDVVMGHRVELYTSDHDPDDPAFSRRDAPIVIEDHAWIGSRAMILKGVRVGRGAVVAAGSVVTADVEPFVLVAGNPARVIRRRGTREFTYHHDGSPRFA